MPNYPSGFSKALGPVTAGAPRKFRALRVARSKPDTLTKPGVAETAAPPEVEFSFNRKPAKLRAI